MSKGEDITTKYKLDISEFKRGIEESNKLIKLANAKFKEASAGMDDWTKSVSGIQAKLQQLGTILVSENKKLENYKKQQGEIDKAYEQNSKRANELKEKLQQLSSQGISKTSEEYLRLKKALNEVEKEQNSNKEASDKLRITILNQQGTINKTEKDIRNYNKALDELEKELKQVADEQKKAATKTQILTKEIDKQEKELNSLKIKYKDIILEQGKNSTEAKELAKNIKSLSSELADNKIKINNASEAADKLDKSLDIDTKTPSEGFTVFKGVLVSLVADGIRRAIDGLKEFAKETLEVGKNFTSAMSQVEAISRSKWRGITKFTRQSKRNGSDNKVFSY